MRSGFSDFTNNRNYLYAEKWEEYDDGSLLKKIILDDGYGKKTLTEQNCRLNINLLEQVKLKTDEKGYFISFVDDSQELKSLQELVDQYKNFIEWRYQNITIDDIPNQQLIYLKEGNNNKTNETWNFKRLVKPVDKFEEVFNEASDNCSKWIETWTKRNLERWAYKEGFRDGQFWKETWYKRVKALSKKRDQDGNIVKNPETGSDQYESDGEEIEESNCEKWGKNEHMQEEWNEKWGEVHMPF